MMAEVGLATLHPEIPELGPPVTEALSLFVRESSEYWDHRSTDHAPNGLFIGGPQEARPWWFDEVKTGEAHKAPATETRQAAYQRMDAEKNRKLYRMSLGVAGYFTGRNRRAA